MKYTGMPFGMWTMFAGSFQRQLTVVLGYDTDTAKAISKEAKPKYRQIIRRLPEFEKADRFKMNLVNCAMIGAFLLSMPERPDMEGLTEYYAKAMMTKPMKWFCRMGGKSKFTEKDIAGMKATTALKAADRNPLFLEHGVLRISRRQRLRGTFYKVRYLRADEGVGAVRPDPRPVPPGLHHERGRRRDRLCAAVYPCLRRAILRLRVQKERVTLRTSQVAPRAAPSKAAPQMCCEAKNATAHFGIKII